MVTVSQNYTERIIMAKKTSSKNSKKFPKTKTPKLNKVVTSSKDDCDGGSCPIDKKKKEDYCRTIGTSCSSSIFVFKSHGGSFLLEII
jgi:hypothetical protein